MCNTYTQSQSQKTTCGDPFMGSSSAAVRWLHPPRNRGRLPTGGDPSCSTACLEPAHAIRHVGIADGVRVEALRAVAGVLAAVSLPLQEAPARGRRPPPALRGRVCRAHLLEHGREVGAVDAVFRDCNRGRQVEDGVPPARRHEHRLALAEHALLRPLLGRKRAQHPPKECARRAGGDPGRQAGHARRVQGPPLAPGEEGVPGTRVPRVDVPRGPGAARRDERPARVDVERGLLCRRVRHVRAAREALLRAQQRRLDERDGRVARQQRVAVGGGHVVQVDVLVVERLAVREGPHAKERGRVSSRVRREGVGAAHQRSRERLPCPVSDVRAALLLCPSGRGPGRRQAAHDDGDARLVEAFLKGVGREVRPAAPRYVARKLLAVFLLGGTRLVDGTRPRRKLRAAQRREVLLGAQPGESAVAVNDELRENVARQNLPALALPKARCGLTGVAASAEDSGRAREGLAHPRLHCRAVQLIRRICCCQRGERSAKG
mmetsp:Transcript_33666/g.110084  ORF Transcript_33666/g.110084 Transcript_33666/m.110084 type:complete len:491 (-) Transcript_33666:222-1694(-)